MSRIVLSGTMGVDLTAVYGDTAANRFKLFEMVFADSGFYVFAHANGAIDAGGVCKILSTGEADEVDTNESGSTSKIIGVAVSALADNEWGWFWRGCGVESVLVASSISADTNLTTTATAGEAGSGGDAIVGGLVSVGSTSGAAAVISCAAYGLLGTN